MKWIDEFIMRRVKVEAKKEAIKEGLIKEGGELGFGLYLNRILALKKSEFPCRPYLGVGHVSFIGENHTKEFMTLSAYYDNKTKNVKVLLTT